MLFKAISINCGDLSLDFLYSNRIFKLTVSLQVGDLSELLFLLAGMQKNLDCWVPQSGLR